MANNSISIVIIGDSTVGKTSLLIRYTKNNFYEDYVPTIFDTYSCNVSCGNEIIKLNLQDTAGTESYAQFRKIASREADAILICFAVDDITSYNNITDKWFKDSEEVCPNAVKILVGTKSDLRYNKDNDNSISSNMCLSLKKILSINYMECSAKADEHVQVVFNAAIQEVLQRRKKLKLSHRGNRYTCIIL